MYSIAEVLAARAAAAARRREVLERTGKKKGRSQRFYASVPWKRLRYKILAANAERHGGKPHCELCGIAAQPGAPLNIDHIEALSRNWLRRLDPTNLQVLCGNCNHGKLAGPARDFRLLDMA